MPRSYSYDYFQVPPHEPRERAIPSDSQKAATKHKTDAPAPRASKGRKTVAKKTAAKRTVARLTSRPPKGKAK